MSRQGSSMFLHWPYSQNYPLHCCTSKHWPDACYQKRPHSSCPSIAPWGTPGHCSSQSCCSYSCSKTCFSPGIGQHCCRDWCNKCIKNCNDYSFYPHSAYECVSNGSLSCEPISEEEFRANMCHRRKCNLSNQSLKCNISCSHTTCSNHHHYQAVHRTVGPTKRKKRLKARNKLKRTLSRICGTESSCSTKNSPGTSLIYGDADRTPCCETDATECWSSTVLQALGVDSEGDARLCSDTVLGTTNEIQTQSLSKVITSCIRNVISKVSHAQCAPSKQAVDSACVVQASECKPKCTSKAEKAERKKRAMQQMKRDDRLFREVIGFPCAGNKPCKPKEREERRGIMKIVSSGMFNLMKPSRTNSKVCCKDSLEIIGNGSHCTKAAIKNKNKRGFRRFLSSLLCNSSCMECKGCEKDKKCTCTPAEKEKKRKERLIEEDRIFREIIGFPFQRTFTTSCPVEVVSGRVPIIVID